MKNKSNNNKEDVVKIFRNDKGEIVKKNHSYKAVVFFKKGFIFTKNEHTGELTIPGGRNKTNETPEETITREFFEETKLKGVELIIQTKFFENRVRFRSPKDRIWRDCLKSWFICTIKIVDQNKFIATKNNIVILDKDSAANTLRYNYEKKMLKKFLSIVKDV